MTLHVIAAFTLFALGVLGGIEWLRDLWRARSDAAVDRHPIAVALHTLATDEERHAERERAQAQAIAERLRRREVVAECELFDIEAMWSRRA